MKEFVESIRLQLNERLSSPLVGAFVLSWCAWNYRMLLVIFSDLTAGEKLQFIDTQLYPVAWQAWLRFLVGPLVCTLIYIFLYPFPSKWIHGYWLRRQLEHKRQRDEIDGETLLTQEESVRIRKLAFQKSQATEDENRRLREELEIAKEELRAKGKEVERYRLGQIIEENEKLSENTLAIQVKGSPLDKIPANNFKPDGSDAPPPLESRDDEIAILRREIAAIRAGMRRDVSGRLSPENLEGGDNSALSNDAATLLLAGSNDDRGIRRFNFVGGASLTAGGKEFITNESTPRERARWDGALNELLLGGYIGRNGEQFYQLTNEGFQMADVIKAMRVPLPASE